MGGTILNRHCADKRKHAAHGYTDDTYYGQRHHSSLVTHHVLRFMLAYPAIQLAVSSNGSVTRKRLP